MRLLLLAALGCGPKEIPPHLRRDAPPGAADRATPPTTLDEAVAQLVGADPLARRARPRDDAWWLGVAESGPIVTWAAVVRADDPPPTDLWDLNARFPGTVAEPLASGARLAALEVILAQTPEDGEALRPTLPWLAPVTATTAPLPAGARGPLEWLTSPTGDPRADALVTAERAALRAWLASPALPVDGVAAAIRPGVHDRLATSPTGILLLGRAADARDPAALDAARAALAAATRLALAGAAADRDAEQAADAAAVEAARVTPEERDPIARLLREAVVAAARSAGAPEGVSVGLVAHAAERMHGTCPDTPCGGVDRHATLTVADRWAETPEAALWRVIAAKHLLDTLDVARDRPSFSASVDELGDVLLGAGASTLPERLLRARRPDEAVWLAVARGLGATDATQWEDARAALAAELVRRCDATLERPLDEADRDAVARIRRRATP